MRKAIIAGNWKMNNNKAESTALINELKPLVKNAKCDVVVCVPFTNLETAVNLTKGTNIKVGAQNIHWAESGAFTGEISGKMLVELGVEYVVIGHSERRQYFGETNESVNKRTIACLKSGLKPIICVGETLTEKEAGKTNEIVVSQTTEAFKGIDKSELDNIVIAYEPVWAIGTGKTATSADANDTIKVIRDTVARLYCKKCAEENVRIQYGGSMNPKNVKELMDMPEIDGGLIGGASLKADDFAKVVNY